MNIKAIDENSSLICILKLKSFYYYSRLTLLMDILMMGKCWDLFD